MLKSEILLVSENLELSYFKNFWTVAEHSQKGLQYFENKTKFNESHFENERYLKYKNFQMMPM